MQNAKHVDVEVDVDQPNKMFFQPILPNFLHSFSIPVSFMKHLERELKGRPLESVVLMTHRHKYNEPQHHWVVHIKAGRHFNHQDWRHFALHHHLCVGDFLIFTHQSHFLFHVSVFDPVSACNRHSPLLHHHANANANANPKGYKRRFGYSNINKKGQPQADSTATATATKAPARTQYPTCMVTLTRYSINKSIVHLPKQFVQSIGLANTRCDIHLRDEKERSWAAYLSYRNCDGQSYIQRGWKVFQLINNLKPGQLIKFQLLDDEATHNPVFKCICSESNKKGQPQAAAAATRAPARKHQPQHPTCRITLTAYSIKKSILYLPRHFVRSSGLANTRCDVKLIDRKQRPWVVNLLYKKGDGQSYIKRGWKDFQLMNELKPGDVIKFQLLDKASHNPVFKCIRLSSSRAGFSRSKA